MNKTIRIISYILLVTLSLITLSSCKNKTKTNTVKQYKIVFHQDGGDFDMTVNAGDSLSINDIKAPNPKEHYTVSWDLSNVSLNNIDRDITINAKYTPVNYTVKWLDEDGSELEIDSTPYNSVPSFDSDTPTKNKDSEYEYAFSGWDKNIESPITGDTTFTAKYDKIKRKYLISFSDGETSIDTVQLEYGETPEYNKTITKESDIEFDYEFDGWDKEFIPVSGNTTYTVVWKKTLRKYVIKFVDKDNNDSLITEETLSYGDSITPPSFPESNVGYHYEWDKEIDETVSGDRIYYRSYKPNTDTLYKVSVIVPKYTSPRGDNKTFLEDTKELIDISMDFSDILGLNSDGYAKGTTDTTPDFSYLINLGGAFKLDTLNSEYTGNISGDGSKEYIFKYDINWENLGFELDDIVTGYINGGWNHESSYLTLGRAHSSNTEAYGLKIHFDFGDLSGNGSNFAITLDHLELSLYKEINVDYAAFNADIEGSYWESKLIVMGENYTLNDWPTSSTKVEDYSVRHFNAIDYLEYCPDVKYIDGIRFEYKRFGTISSMGEAGNTDYYIMGLNIKERDDLLTVTYKDGDLVLDSIKLASGSKLSIPLTSPLKDGYYFIGWYNDDLTQEFDFDKEVTVDTTIRAKYEEAVMYKVKIEAESYSRTDGKGKAFTFPSEKEYTDITNEFMDLLGLSYDNENDYYYAYGKLNTVPDFTKLEELPEVFKLVGTIPTDKISEETVTYSFKYSINEEVFGYDLSKLNIGWYGDETEYVVGLHRVDDKAGLLIKATLGLVKAYSTPLQIVFDDIDIEFYQEIKLSVTAKYQTTGKNIKFYLASEEYDLNDNLMDIHWFNTNYSSYTVDMLGLLANKNQKTIKRLDVRPASIDSAPNTFYLFIDELSVIEKENNHIVTFVDNETVVTKKVVDNGTVTPPSWNKQGYTLSWDKPLTNITEDVTINAVWEKDLTIAQYKVTVKVAKYEFVKNVDNKRFFNITNKTYVDNTSEYVNLFGLNAEFKKDGKIGEAPSFDLSKLPSTYKLDTTLSNIDEVIKEDGTSEYTLVFDIDTDALGVTLDKIVLYDPINPDGYTFTGANPYLILSYESETLNGVKIFIKAKNKVEIRILLDEEINFNNYKTLNLNAKVKVTSQTDVARGFKARPFTLITTDKGDTAYYTYDNNAWGRVWYDTNDLYVIDSNILEEATATQKKAEKTLTDITTINYISIIHTPWYAMASGSDANGIDLVTYLTGITIETK